MNLLLARIVIAIAVAACCTATANAQTSPLSLARGAFKTQISFPGDGRAPATPPASVFRKITYPSAVGPLAAYLSLDPQDGSRHPAIIWITGGDCNSIDDIWSPQPLPPLFRGVSVMSHCNLPSGRVCTTR